MDCFISCTDNETTRGTKWKKINSWKKKFYEISFYHACLKRCMPCLLVANSCDDKRINLVGMTLAHFLSLNLVGDLFVTAANVIFGDRSRYMASQDPKPKMVEWPSSWKPTDPQPLSWDCWINKPFTRQTLPAPCGWTVLGHISKPVL